ncbi:DsbA family protein [Sphingomonas rubra]|uniref:Thioredoxin n=1 Tax=Sphingomonas rubra TaxID=634430 RepID=A0A1I5U5W5_9SPHN|nr:thioredoxin domain-containing protein [Sphingomonas rubra]SFP90673.1 Thioredoxin [Sphingomonas rubra]
MKLAPLLLSVVALAACSGENGNSSSPAAPVAAVAAPAGTDWTTTTAKTEEGYLLGNPNAPVKLVEYGSRLCPACRGLAESAYRPLIDNYVKSGKVSFEFREFLIHGAADLPPALLGQCAGAEPFFPILEQMYAAQTGFNDKLQALTPAQQQQLQTAKPTDAVRMLAQQMGLIDFMKQRGLPEARVNQCLADTALIDKLTKQTQDRGADGTVTGTPTVLVNGTKIDGIAWTDVEKALKAAGA